jgi:nucleoside-diphosphate-sugar epimerase
MTKIFATGITGLVGSAFAVQLLREREDYEIVALARGGANQNAADRTEEIIREQCKYDDCPEATETVLSRLTVLEGDIVHFNPEDKEVKDAIKGCEIIFHCAADVNLGKDPEGKTFTINYEGTRNMLNLARHLNAKAFHYVSTAYIAGCLEGKAMEDEPADNGFFNSYEKSKFMAEGLVRSSGIPFSVYRPAIVTGRLKDGMTRKPLAFYRVLEFVAKVKKHICTKNGLDAAEFAPLTFRFDTRPSDQVYFSPIDFISDSIVKLFQLPVVNKAYHLTGARPTTTKDITLAMQETLKVGHVNVIECDDDKSKEEKLINKFLGDLLPYFSSRIDFDQTNIREALGDEAVDWHYDVPALDIMMKEYYRHFFPNVEWLQKISAE